MLMYYVQIDKKPGGEGHQAKGDYANIESDKVCNTGCAEAQGESVAEAAIGYARLGLAVFPCSPDDKRPLTPHGFKDASLDASVIAAWWHRWPRAMIGHPTNNMFSVDQDRKPGSADGVATWEGWVMMYGAPETLTNETPSTGRHSFFWNHDGIRSIPINKLAPGIEIKGAGGYVILPPSRMRDGRVYRPLNGCTTIAEPPQWLLDKIADYQSRPHKASSSRVSGLSFSEECCMTPEQLAKVEEQCEQFAGLGISFAPWDIFDDTPDRLKIETALEGIPPDNQEVRMKAGAALHHELGEAGFALFDTWTSAWPGYISRKVAARWKRLTTMAEYTAGTIYDLADEYDPGWRERFEAAEDYEPDEAEDEAEAEAESVAEQPSVGTADVKPKPASPAPTGLIIKPMSSYEMADPEWLWPERFEIGALSLIIGDPETGKSSIATNMEARITQGRDWPNGEGRAPKGSAIILAAEDSIVHTAHPRFVAAGGNPDKLYVIEAIALRGNTERSFNLIEDIARLDKAIVKIGDVRYVRFDSLGAYLGKVGKLDSYRDTNIRAVLTPLVRLAERRRIAVFGIMHLAKN